VTAASVGLVALYRWEAEAYGVYAGLGIVGAILIAVATIFATAAAIKGKSLASNEAEKTGTTTDVASTVADSAVGNPNDVPPAHGYAVETPDMGSPPAATASDLVGPLASLLSKITRDPTLGNSIVDEVVNSLEAAARGTVDDVVNSAASIIRDGDRTNIVLVLTGAAFMGWLLAHHSQHRSEL